MATSPEQVAKVVDLRKTGMSFAEIAKQVGVGESLAKYVWYQNKPKGKPIHTNNGTMHYLTATEIKNVKMMHERGMNAREIMEKMPELTHYNVYKAIHTNGGKGSGQGKRNGHPEGAQRKSDNKLDLKIFKLKQDGLTLRAIAAKLDLAKGTVSSAYYRYLKSNGRSKGHSKGEELNGNNANDSNGSTSANKNILIGIAFAETTRFIDNLSERIAVPPETLRRRLSELLGHSPLR